MQFYLKIYDDGWDYSPVGLKIDEEKLKQGFIIVDEIPQEIKDKEYGGKDYVAIKTEMELKIEDLETRVKTLEEKRIPK